MKLYIKKIALAFFATGIALVASSQTMDDAIRFSENNYEGTARTVAMGNAFTALGGDLGAVDINPAGSAVANYSQFSITPALTIGINTAQGTLDRYDNFPYFQNKMRNSRAKFDIPNIGFTFNWKTKRTRGVKNFSFSFLSNTTNTFSDNLYAKGVNSTTSYLGSIAELASHDGMTGTLLEQDNKWDVAPWLYAAAYPNLITTYNGWDDGFVGATEQFDSQGNKFLSGDINQVFERKVSGSKSSYLLNFGMDISDIVYLGVNLGINSISYTSTEVFREEAVNHLLFNIADDVNPVYFKNATIQNYYRASGAGFYSKIGIIVNPFKGLRLGAAIQTPTLNSITEKYTLDTYASYTDGNFEAKSPLGEYKYTFREPLRANFGVAYTFGNRGLVSLDYEVQAYKNMKFNPGDLDSFNDFSQQNSDIREFLKSGQNLRLGGEFKPISALALRAGYGLISPAEKGSKAWTNNASLGLGYSSKGSFFADLAVRGTFYNAEYIMPYEDYVFQVDKNTGDYLTDDNGFLLINPDYFAPKIKSVKQLWKIFLTIGFRF